MAGLPDDLYSRLQSMTNAAARQSPGSIRHSDLVTDTVVSFYLPRAPERVQFNLAVLMTFRSLHGL
jgi:hypothetical protein